MSNSPSPKPDFAELNAPPALVNSIVIVFEICGRQEGMRFDCRTSDKFITESVSGSPGVLQFKCSADQRRILAVVPNPFVVQYLYGVPNPTLAPTNLFAVPSGTELPLPEIDPLAANESKTPPTVQ